MTVMILGLSVEGLVLCPFFAFGLSLADRMAGVRFLLGRLLGLVCFGVAVCLLGKAVHIDERIMNLIFGVTIILLGMYRAVVVEEGNLWWKIREYKVRLGIKSRCGGKGTPAKAGFGLGLFRGLFNPGRKYLYLAPFLLDLGVFKGLAISFVYGLSSSVYLIVGFVSAGFINKMVRHKQRLGVVGGIILMLVGSYYVVKARSLVL
ncbi:MAG: sulfite exporter TauE/SafE family protein [Desulfuromonadaceae bacterium]